MLMRTEGFWMGTAAAAEVTLGAVTAYGPFSADPWSSASAPGAAFTLAADDDLVLIVVTKATNNNVAWATSNFGGVVPTLLDEVEGTGSKSIEAAWIPAASLPASGSKSWSIDMPGATRGFLLIAALKGAAQTTPAVNEVIATATSVGPTAVTATAGGIAFQAVNKDTTDPITAGGGEATILAAVETSNSDYALFSRKASVGATVSMSATWTNSEDHTQLVIGVSPA